MDSLATLQIPSIGYGIRYEFGIFQQQIRRRLAGRGAPTSGCASAIPGRWRDPTSSSMVKLGGRTEGYTRRARPPSRALGARARGQRRALRHAGPRLRREEPQHAAPVAARRPPESFDFYAFNVGDYVRRGRRQDRVARTSPRCSIRTTNPRRARSCASSSSTSSCRAPAGHDPHLPAARRRSTRALPREVRDPAQRHAPGGRPSPS